MFFSIFLYSFSLVGLQSTTYYTKINVIFLIIFLTAKWVISPIERKKDENDLKLIYYKIYNLSPHKKNKIKIDISIRYKRSKLTHTGTAEIFTICVCEFV